MTNEEPPTDVQEPDPSAPAEPDPAPESVEALPQPVPATLAHPPAPEEPARTLLEKFLVARDERCPSCRASLRGLSGRRCPECRQPLVLCVGLERPNLGSYLIGLAAVLVAAALNVFIAFHFLLEVLRLGLTDDRPAFLFITVTGAILTIVALVVWFILGPAFRRQGFLRRWSVALLLWLLPIGSFVVIVRLLSP
ncbi:MAG: hypothetical protein ACYTGG_05340 [Planctomycetota bacterium]